MKLLGGLPPRTFLRRHWQKRPLLVRGALPGFAGVLEKSALLALARRDDAESRIVKRRAGRWNTEHGPFGGEITLGRQSTLLVSGVNLHLKAADALLRRFSFVPQARLDDLMVSYAAPGGGVGPHFDSYDVFLVQGEGRRIWRLMRPKQFSLVPDAPLKLIDGFRAPKKEYLLEPGDLLYLPPGWGHDGVALDACMTCSVGFRAPRGAELAAAFLDHLHERGLPDAGYRDPGLLPARNGARVPEGLIDHSKKTLDRIRWSRRERREVCGGIPDSAEAARRVQAGQGPAPARALQGSAGSQDTASVFEWLVFHQRGIVAHEIQTTEEPSGPA